MAKGLNNGMCERCAVSSIVVTVETVSEREITKGKNYVSVCWRCRNQMKKAGQLKIKRAPGGPLSKVLGLRLTPGR